MARFNKGDSVGEYTLERLLARSEPTAGRQMQRDVWLAAGPSDEPVALKMLSSACPASRRRFEGEVEMHSGIDHPNVVRFIARVSEACFAMEYVPGTLEHLRESRKYTNSAIVEIVRQAALGLDALHRQGIIHLDMKSSNVYWDVKGPEAPSRTSREPYMGAVKTNDLVVKVADLGISGWVGDFGCSRSLVSGTQGYMSPEQKRGSPLNDRSDVYSLGVVLYELFTGLDVSQEQESLTMHAGPGRAVAGGTALVQRATLPPRLGSKENAAEERYARGIKDLISLCMQERPGTRPGAGELASMSESLQREVRADICRAEYGGIWLDTPERVPRGHAFDQLLSNLGVQRVSEMPGYAAPSRHAPPHASARAAQLSTIY